ncbi:MAG TPA: polyphosphate kinase 1 [Gaiellaceae bacterium]|nr:polyphosphate kinase 1 [Gaiellaceae bacterium]
MAVGTAEATARFLNRELSWLDFNGRVLEMASDTSLPLLERVNFCSIFSSNLDEFFMVRVAGLMDQAAAGVSLRSPDGLTPQQALREIRLRTLRLTAEQAKLWKRQLKPKLAEEDLVVAEIEDLNAAELEELEQLFDREIFPVLTPLAVGPGQPFPYISGLSLSLGLFVRDGETGEERFARVKVPELLPRFLPVGTRGRYLPLERVIRHFLAWLFPSMEIAECTFFRVTRDADFSVSDEADDLLEAVELELQRRRFGEPVRVEVSGSCSARMLTELKRGLGVDEDQVYLLPSLLDLADLLEFVKLDRPDLKEDPWVPVIARRFQVQTGAELFEEISRSDVLVHHPYDSFAGTFEAFMRNAARDASTVAIKTSVYRTSDDSPHVPALMEAAEEGKQTVCLVELKARFDERRNIEWSRELESVGVHVVYGFPSLKIHAKGTLIVRREEDGLRRYAHIGTGNYNAVTARLYEDFGLFTRDEEITADLADLFNYLTGFGRPQGFRKLLVAPFNARQTIVEQIQACAAAADAGKDARIRLKVNHLADEEIVTELYAAADAGVVIDIFARTTCTLCPRRRGGKEDIRVRTLLGPRVFEHSRFFIFEADGQSSFYLGSADLMPRNLDHRIEILVPIEDGRAQRELSRTFDSIMEDTRRSWALKADGTWEPVRPKKGSRGQSMHGALMRRARARARAAAPRG